MPAVAERSYRDLLGQYQPQVIKTEAENERAKSLSVAMSDGSSSYCLLSFPTSSGAHIGRAAPAPRMSCVN